MVFYRSFRFIYAAHLGPARTFPQQARQFRELGFRTQSVNFHSFVIQITDVSANAQRIRGVLDEIPKADPLNSSANPIELCCFVSTQRSLTRG